LLSGAKLEFKPITPNASWAESAPNIRGIKGYNEKAAVTLFPGALLRTMESWHRRCLPIR
jgi:hypothetical protein